MIGANDSNSLKEKNKIYEIISCTNCVSNRYDTIRERSVETKKNRKYSQKTKDKSIEKVSIYILVICDRAKEKPHKNVK